ncbi:hypothetical protein B0H19DRAFT_1156627 [Mycena capillaripes]|nr:hypothetical protein B0H19DRAFT_1156627 [Mycena capillaripes]
MRLLSGFLVLTLSLGEIIVISASSPCSAGALVYTENNKCECRRHNGLMGRLRSGCSATWDDGQCLGTCNAPGPKEQNWLAAEAEKCPAEMRACPVGILEYECVSPALDVDNCGGCASTGEGVACGDYPGVRGAACVEGVCEVYSCFRGYTLADGECIRSPTRTRVKTKTAASAAS